MPRYTSLGIRLADLARTHRDPSATTTEIFSGQFLEAWVSTPLVSRSPIIPVFNNYLRSQRLFAVSSYSLGLVRFFTSERALGPGRTSWR